MLTSLIRNPPPKDAPEDVLDSTALTLFYPDAQRTFHGDPGSSVTYKSKRYGNIKLQLADPQGSDERWLFAHHVWNSSVLLAELMSNEASRAEREDDSQEKTVRKNIGEEFQDELEAPGRWSVKGERVLELGAGTALASIIAIHSHAAQVFVTDYPSPTILSNIRDNIDNNTPSHPSSQPHQPQPPPTKISISPHEWGTTSDPLSLGHAYSFTRIIACDCLWLDGEHEALAKSMRHFLLSSSSSSTDPRPDADPRTKSGTQSGARVWVIAGYHTGKKKAASFFETARRRARLEVEGRWEVDSDMRTRAWTEPDADGMEREGERNRWQVVAILKIADEIEKKEEERGGI